MPADRNAPAIVDLVLAEYDDPWMGVGMDDDISALADTLDRMTGSVEASKALLRERDAVGVATYGTRLYADTRKPDGSRYDWRQEAAEELADALLYLRAAIEEGSHDR